MTWMGAIPRLALVQPRWTATGWVLLSPAGDTIPLPPAEAGTPCLVKAWNGPHAAFDSLHGCDAGDAVAAFVSEVAGKRVRMAWLATSQHRPNPVHITTTPSLQQLATHLGGNLDGADGHRRFRPNLVIDAIAGETLSAFVEEQMKELTRPPLMLEVTGRCERCIVIDIDPATAEMGGPYFADTKEQSTQRHPGKPACFGIYARARTAGRLAIGDTLAVQLRG